MRVLTRPTYPVRVRILAAILAVTALGLVVAGGVAFLLQRTRMLAVIDDELQQELATARVLVDGPSTGDAPPDAANADPAATETPGFATTADLVYEIVRVVTPPLAGGAVGIVDGEVRYVPGIETALALDSPAFLQEIAESTASGEIVLGGTSIDGRTVRYLAIPVAVEGSDSSGVFVSAIDVSARLADAEAAMTVYAWVALAVLVVVALVGWFVAGHLLAPLRQLRQTTARITAGALDERIPVSGNDDLSELTETINAMIARLQESFVGQRRIVNDVRHELATPITIIRGHIEITDPYDPDDVQQNLAVADDELDRMSGLLAQITHLADAERAAAHRPRPVDVEELTRSVFEKARVIGDHEWTLAAVGEGRILVDASQITQAWLQLADNAAKYSAAGTPIELGSALTPTGLRCWVTDSGPGIPESVRARIFERFGRADSSRGTAGSGLGLSIVQALVQAHGGRIELATEVGHGSTFTMVLPPSGGSRTNEVSRE